MSNESNKTEIKSILENVKNRIDELNYIYNDLFNKLIESDKKLDILAESTVINKSKTQSDYEKLFSKNVNVFLALYDGDYVLCTRYCIYRINDLYSGAFITDIDYNKLMLFNDNKSEKETLSVGLNILIERAFTSSIIFLTKKEYLKYNHNDDNDSYVINIILNKNPESIMYNTLINLAYDENNKEY